MYNQNMYNNNIIIIIYILYILHTYFFNQGKYTFFFLNLNLGIALLVFMIVS